MYWSAFILGFLGSTHCVLMCGPIVISLTGQKTLTKFIFSRFIYNFGRILTYTLLGIIFGLFGELIAVTQLQQFFSIFMGLLISSMAFIYFSKFIESKLTISAHAFISKAKNLLKSIYKRPNLISSFFSGMFNGLLPCGLVYVALAGALATTSITSGAYFMLAFGLGTFPAMVVIAMLGKISRPSFFTYFTKLSSVFVFLLGLLLVIRGLGLDIPYLSPTIAFLYPSLSEPVICN